MTTTNTTTIAGREVDNDELYEVLEEAAARIIPLIKKHYPNAEAKTHIAQTGSGYIICSGDNDVVDWDAPDTDDDDDADIEYFEFEARISDHTGRGHWDNYIDLDSLTNIEDYTNDRGGVSKRKVWRSESSKQEAVDALVKDVADALIRAAAEAE